MTTKRLTITLALALALTACGDDEPGGSRGTTVESLSSAPGDGDGDPGEVEGDGDGDGAPGDGDGEAGDGDGDPSGDGDGGPGDGDGDSEFVPCPGGGQLQLEALFHNDFGSQPMMVYDTCSLDYAGVSPGGLLAQVEFLDGEVQVVVRITEQPQPGTYAVQDGDPSTSVTMNVAGGGLGPGWTGAYLVSTGEIDVIAYAPGTSIEFTVTATSLMQDESHAVDIYMHAILPL